MANDQDPPETTPRRPLRYFAAAGVLIASWYGMQLAHELGHVLAAWTTGGTVQRVAVPVLGFSRTDVSPNPQALWVAWAGPVVGVLLPAVLWGAARLCFARDLKPLRFFVGWCLVCNGAYLGLGWIDRVGDTGDLLRHGAAVLLLIAFGAGCIPAGLWCWHGLGSGMGLAKRK